MLDITFYKKQNNDNFVPSTIELCDEDYEKLIVLNFAKKLSPWKRMFNSGRRRILYWCCAL